jgi:hypothetical protein
MSPRPHVCRGLLLVALAGVCTPASHAQVSQDEGPVVVGEQRPKFRGVELVRLDASLDFWNQWREDSLKQQGQPTLHEKESLYRQTLDLSGDVTFGHKNLVDLSGDLKIGLEEDSIHSDLTQSSNSYVALTTLYDLKALFLANSQVPTTLYGRRDESYTHQDFGGSIRTTTTELGAIAQLRSTVAPTSIQVFHREQDQADQLGRGGFGYTQDSAIVHSDLRIADNQRALIDYTFDHVDQSGSSGPVTTRDTYDQHDGTITHWLTFGPNARDSLRSSLNLQDRTGSFAEQIARLEEELILQHTPRLETRYNLTLEDLNRQDTEQRLARGSFLVRHRLFDSLTTTATLGASTLDVVDVFNSDEFFGTLAFDYTKRVPYGRLDAAVSFAGTRQDNGPRGSTVPVVNNVFIFSDPFPVTISRRNIIPSSIVVRDSARLRVFIEGADYTVSAFPDRVELHRIIGGAIANGQAVSVDFVVGPEPANTIDSLTQTYSLRYDITEGTLSGLGLYTIYRQLDQSVDAPDPSRFPVEDVQELRYGLDYRIGGATFTAERTHHDSNFTPYDSWRLQAQYDRRFSRTSLLSLNFSHEEVDYRFTGQHVALNLATGRWSHKLGEELDWSLHMEGRLENHNDSPDIRGVNGGLDVSWHRRQTTIYGSIFVSEFEAGPTTTFSETLSIGLRRAF